MDLAPVDPDRFDAAKLVRDQYGKWQDNQDELARIDRWYRDELSEIDLPKIPDSSPPEMKQLRARATTPWLRMAIEGLNENLIVQGYRTPGADDDALAWSFWQANGFDSRQVAVHESALRHGQSFVSVMPGVDPLTGSTAPKFKGHSGRKMLAFYEDASVDEWPVAAMSGVLAMNADGDQVMRFSVYSRDGLQVVESLAGDDDFKVVSQTPQPSSINVCPVIRYTSSMDLDGVIRGEVAPYIGMVSRINQDTFDRLVVQRYGAFVVRTVAGMKEPETDDEKRATKLLLEVGDLLVSESTDTKFGTLQPTQLQGFIDAKETDVKDFASVTKTPPQEMLGELVNLSAEALAAAEAGRNRKGGLKKLSFGESHEQLLRLAAAVAGDVEGATNYDAEVIWADLESRSLSATADALGKVAQMLNVPVEVLWRKLPGFTQADVEEAKAILERGSSVQDAVLELFGEIDPGDEFEPPAAA